MSIEYDEATHRSTIVCDDPGCTATYEAAGGDAQVIIAATREGWEALWRRDCCPVHSPMRRAMAATA